MLFIISNVLKTSSGQFRLCLECFYFALTQVRIEDGYRPKPLLHCSINDIGLGLR